MVKLLILYYSMYGHIETMANSIAEGAKSVDGIKVDIKRVPETIDSETAKTIGVKLGQPAPVAEPADLSAYDGIIFGTPTRFGNMTAQMRNFLDRTGKIWVEGGLIGKVAGVFTSTGTGGGNESTIMSFVNTLIHHGMIFVGLPYSCPELLDISEPRGGSPWGAGTLAEADGSRQPSEKELAMARFQGRHIANIVKKLNQN